MCGHISFDRNTSFSQNNKILLKASSFCARGAPNHPPDHPTWKRTLCSGSPTSFLFAVYCCVRFYRRKSVCQIKLPFRSARLRRICPPMRAISTSRPRGFSHPPSVSSVYTLAAFVAVIGVEGRTIKFSPALRTMCDFARMCSVRWKDDTLWIFLEISPHGLRQYGRIFNYAPDTRFDSI